MYKIGKCIRYDKVEIMKKIILGTLLTATIGFGDTLYTQEFIPSSGINHKTIDTGINNYVKVDDFFYKKGEHLHPIYFDEEILLPSSQKDIDNMIKKIKATKSKDYIITLVSHTSYRITENISVKRNFWIEFWQSMGNFGILTHKESIARGNKYLKSTISYLKKYGIDTKRIYTENRLDKDPLSTEATSDGREINNRIDITLYL